MFDHTVTKNFAYSLHMNDDFRKVPGFHYVIAPTSQALKRDLGKPQNVMTKKSGISSVSAPSVVGEYYLQPQKQMPYFLHKDLPCKGPCSLTGGCITYAGAQTENVLKANLKKKSA